MYLCMSFFLSFFLFLHASRAFAISAIFFTYVFMLSIRSLFISFVLSFSMSVFLYVGLSPFVI